MLGIAIFIIFAETGIRIYLSLKMSSESVLLSTNPELIFEHKPSIEFKNNYGITVRYNSLGFIGDEIGEKRGLRILGIGDSITAGTYLQEGHRYLNVAGEILRQKTSKDIEITNGAVGGYNTWQELAMIKEKGLKINPDLIIVGICLNDHVKSNRPVYKNWLGRVAENIRDGSKARYLDLLYQRSDLYKFIYDRLAKKRREIKDKKSYEKYLRDYKFDISDTEWKEWMKPIEDMGELGRKNGIKVIFVIFPLHNQIVKGEKFSFKPLTDFFQQRGEYFIDLMEDFTARYKKEESLYREFDIIHPNSDGHKLTAEYIVNYIIANRIMEK